MKKTLILTVIFMVCTVAAIIGYPKIADMQEDAPDVSASIFYEGIDKSNIAYSEWAEADFLPVDFARLIQKCDIVVTGRFLDKTGSEMLSAGVVVTKTQFQIDEVLGGEVVKPGETISVAFTGGIVTVEEYNALLSEAAIEKQGLTETEGYIESTLGDLQAYPMTGTNYLLFLIDGKLGPKLYGERYSMLKIDDSIVFNEFSEETKSLDEIRDMISKR